MEFGESSDELLKDKQIHDEDGDADDKGIAEDLKIEEESKEPQIVEETSKNVSFEESK